MVISFECCPIQNTHPTLEFEGIEGSIQDCKMDCEICEIVNCDCEKNN